MVSIILHLSADNQVLCRYEGSLGQGDQSSSFPSSQQDPTGDHGQVQQADQRGGGELMRALTNTCYQDLIETVIRLQASVEEQGKKAADLEDYVDSLLIKVMEASPVLLEKNLLSSKPSK